MTRNSRAGEKCIFPCLIIQFKLNSLIINLNKLVVPVQETLYWFKNYCTSLKNNEPVQEQIVLKDKLSYHRYLSLVLSGLLSLVVLCCVLVLEQEWEVFLSCLTLSAQNMPYDILLNSPKLSL